MPFHDLLPASAHLAQATALRHQFSEHAIRNDKVGGRPLEQLRLIKEAGLVALLVPRTLGGQGEPWSTVLRIGREFARTDGSIGHLYGYHFVSLYGAVNRGSPAQAEALLRGTATHQWFWGNAINSFSRSLHGRRDADGSHVLDGHRPFSSGSHIADRILVAWEDEATQERFMATVPGEHPGVEVLDDWDGMGQRQTGSGTTRFHGVRIAAADVLRNPLPPGRPAATLGALMQQSVLLNVFVGSAQGALDEAAAYTRDHSRPWIHSGVSRHVDDPWVQSTYGELKARLEAATLLADRAALALDHVWSRGEALTLAERGEAAVAIAAANAYAGDVALEVTSRVFEVMGARSAVNSNGFDRFWRNVRTHTLHNPAQYKYRSVGRWLLTSEAPEPDVFR